MTDYAELVKKLKEFAQIPAHCENVASCDDCTKEDICMSFTNERIIKTTNAAADAIEHLDDLMRRYKDICDKMADNIDKLRNLCKALYYRSETLPTPPKEETETEEQYE